MTAKKLKEADLKLPEPMKKVQKQWAKNSDLWHPMRPWNSKESGKSIRRTRNPLMMMSALKESSLRIWPQDAIICGSYSFQKFGKKLGVRIRYEEYNLFIPVNIIQSNGNGSQELHYLGILLDIIYRFAWVKRASYASAGGKVDFYLTGQQKDEGHDEGNFRVWGIKSSNMENTIFRVIAKLGAALTLYKQTELYLEPHIAYWVSRIIRVYTIYGKINLQLLINVGNKNWLKNEQIFIN